MSVVIESTLGDITVDLFLDQRPITCLNFLKLCKMKYYNFNLFHTIRSGFIAQTGDPTGEGDGGESIWGLLQGPEKRFFSAEKMPKIRHTNVGLISMVCTGDHMVGSQFFFTLGSELDSLDGLHCVIGEVTEGHEVLRKLNEVICDDSYRPYRDVRITHTVVLEDPFSDPAKLVAPSRSPSPNAERLKGGRIAPDEEIDETKGKDFNEIQEMIEEKEAKARATILEIVGDIPDADIAPPENVLFVCKLNPVTTDDDLEIIFSRFGKIVSCEVIRDKQTGNSLQYAFIEFDNKKSCEDAYLKMDNVLIDDRRIHVDFSQSVSKIKWLGKGKGVKYFDEQKNNSSSRNFHDELIKKNHQSHNSANRKRHRTPESRHDKHVYKSNKNSNISSDKKINKDIVKDSTSSKNHNHRNHPTKDTNKEKYIERQKDSNSKSNSHSSHSNDKQLNKVSNSKKDSKSSKKNSIEKSKNDKLNIAKRKIVQKESKKNEKEAQKKTIKYDIDVKKSKSERSKKIKKSAKKCKSSSDSYSSSSDSSMESLPHKKKKKKQTTKKKGRRRSPSTSSSSSTDTSSSSSSSSCTSDSSSDSSSSSSDCVRHRKKCSSKKKTKK